MIGVDIENISRFEHWTDEGYKRIFSESEIEYAKNFVNQSEHFCGFFCVKEALVKALDDDSINFGKIEILHNENGKPFINKNAYVKQLLNEYNLNDIDISISHTKDYAVAVVLIIKRK